MNKTFDISQLNWFNLISLPYVSLHLTLAPFLKSQEKQEKSFEDLLYESYANLGISLCFKDSSFFCVYLYGDFNKNFRKFEGNLPYNLDFKMNCEEIVSKFGEPNGKTGGKTIPIAISYDNLGLEINFITNSWNDYKSPISFICLFQKENNDDKSICGVCRKKGEYFCGKCRLVKYCGVQCQKTHWKFHKNYCLL